MKLQIKYDINLACKVIMAESLAKIGVDYNLNGLGEIELKVNLSPQQITDLEDSIKKYGIELISDPKTGIVQSIKDAIVEMIYLEDKVPNVNISDYLADKMNLSYGYISTVFSEITHTSISNYIILQRIEYAKQLLSEGALTLSEISWKLNYSSLAHFSNQFKKTTGLTPSTFQKIIKKRKIAA